MGLFDKLLKRGLQAVEEAVGDAISDAISDTLKEKLGTSEQTSSTYTQPSSTATTGAKADNRSFEEKLTAALNNLGSYEIRKNISPDVIEQEAGHELYTRGGCYALPDALTYAVYKDDQRVLFINLWELYSDYRRLANRKIKQYCDDNGIKMLDFFDYLPNEAAYMEDRIRKALA